MRATRLVITTVLSAMALACGGSGGGGTTIDASTLSGTYGIFTYDGQEGPIRGRSTVGRADADGAGMVSGVVAQNDDGTFTTGNTFAFDYTLGGAGNLDWQFGALGTVLSGGCRADGYGAILAPSKAGTNPGVQILFRRSGSYTNASLTGTFHTVMYAVDLTPTATSSIGTTTFSGANTVTRAVSLTNVGGNVNTLGTWSIPGTYAVDPSGVVLAQMSFDVAGQIFPGNDVVVMAGGIVNTQLPLITALIRQTSGASASTFSGGYWVVSLQLTPGGFVSETGTITANGNGNGEYSGWNNDGTSITPFGPRPFTYTVDSNGTVNLTGGLAQYRGAVSANGDFVALGGSTTNLQPPTFYFLMRK